MKQPCRMTKDGQFVAERNGERLVAHSFEEMKRLYMQSDRRAEQRLELQRAGRMPR